MDIKELNKVLAEALNEEVLSEQKLLDETFLMTKSLKNKLGNIMGTDKYLTNGAWIIRKDLIDLKRVELDKNFWGYDEPDANTVNNINSLGDNLASFNAGGDIDREIIDTVQIQGNTDVLLKAGECYVTLNKDYFDFFNKMQLDLKYEENPTSFYKHDDRIYVGQVGLFLNGECVGICMPIALSLDHYSKLLFNTLPESLQEGYSATKDMLEREAAEQFQPFISFEEYKEGKRNSYMIWGTDLVYVNEHGGQSEILTGASKTVTLNKIRAIRKYKEEIEIGRNKI